MTCQTQLPDTETEIETQDSSEHDTTWQDILPPRERCNKILSAEQTAALAGDKWSQNILVVIYLWKSLLMVTDKLMRRKKCI